MEDGGLARDISTRGAIDGVGPTLRSGVPAVAGRWLALALLYFALTIWFTWPLAGQVNSAVVGPPGDNLYFTWLVHWYHKAIVDLRWPVQVNMLNVPEGWSLAYNEMTPAMALLGAPGFLAGGAAFAYNLTFFLSFVLSGLFTALWVRRVTGRMGPAIVAGIVFAFAPYRLSHAFGHLNLLGTQWMPLYFFCLTEMLLGGRVWWGVCAALGLAALAGTSQYYFYMTAVLTIPYTLTILWRRPGTVSDRRFLTNAGIAGAVALPLIIVLVWPYVVLARQGQVVLHQLADVSIWSASPTDFLLPPPVHWLWGDWVNLHFDRHLWLESTLNVGLVPLMLAIAGWWTARRGHTQASLIARTALLAALVAFVLALGTEFHWLGQRVTVPVPAALQSLTGAPRVPIRLPGYFLFEYLPFYDGMRVWMRWGIFVSLFVAVLAGLGVDRLTRGWSRGATVFAIALAGVLVVTEFTHQPYPLTPVEGRPVDVWLAAQTDRFAVVQMPPDQLGAPQETFHTLFHGHPFVGAFFGVGSTPQYRRIEPVLRTFPSLESVETLKRLGVRWVLIDLARYPPSIREQAASAGLHPMVELSGQLVMRIH